MNGIIVLLAIMLIASTAGITLIITKNQTKVKFKRKLKKEGTKIEKDFASDEIQNLINRVQQGNSTETSIDELDEEIQKSIQQIAISENLQEAGDKRTKAATTLYTAEGTMLTALGRQQTRIDREKELNEESVNTRIEGETILSERQKLWEEWVKQEEREISDKLEFGTKKIEANEKLSLAQKEQALKELERKTEVDRKKLEAQKMLKQLELETELDLQKRKELAENDSKLIKQIQEATLLINASHLKKAAERGNKKSSGSVWKPALVVMIIGMGCILLQRLF